MYDAGLFLVIMVIEKVINNNVISSFENGAEVIVTGKGIGFGKKHGDEIDKEKIEKIFHLPEENVSQYEKLVSKMPYEHVRLANQIIHNAKLQLNRHLNRNVYITLTDHLNFAIERSKKGIVFHNELLWEISKFYKAEFDIGKQAVKLVKEATGVALPDDEAGFIALHIVNAEMDGDMRTTSDLPAIIKDVVNIVTYTLGINIDEESISYERFITHLKFLTQRAIAGTVYGEDDELFLEGVQNHYKKEYACASKITEYLSKKLNFTASEEERVYLTVHIARIVKESKI